MKRILLLVCLGLFVSNVFAADDVVSAVAGRVKAVDSGTKTSIVETDKGVKHTFHYTDKVTVHGAKMSPRHPTSLSKALRREAASVCITQVKEVRRPLTKSM